MIWSQGAGTDGRCDSVCRVVKSVDEVEDEREYNDREDEVLQFEHINHSRKIIGRPGSAAF